MPSHTASIYESVTARIVAALEAGVVPWHRPWRSVAHHNSVTGRPYSGVNILLLSLTALERGFEPGAWMTYRQAQCLGGHVRRGEHGTAIVWWRTPDGPPADPDADPDTRQRSYWLARTYIVFNAAQVEGLAVDVDEAQRGPAGSEAFEAAVARYGADIRHGGDQAYYDSATDRIQMPPRAWFDPPDRYYGVLGHELVHHSGAAHRLARDLSGRFGSECYGVEELVAELGSAFLTGRFGLQHHTDANAAYIASWLRVLRGDSRAVFAAARIAQAAADYIVPPHEAPAGEVAEAEREAVAG